MEKYKTVVQLRKVIVTGHIAALVFRYERTQVRCETKTVLANLTTFADFSFVSVEVFKIMT